METTGHHYNLRRKRRVDTDETTRKEIAPPAGAIDAAMDNRRPGTNVEEERIPRHVLEAGTESETEDGGKSNEDQVESEDGGSDRSSEWIDSRSKATSLASSPSSSPRPPAGREEVMMPQLTVESDLRAHFDPRIPSPVGKSRESPKLSADAGSFGAIGDPEELARQSTRLIEQVQRFIQEREEALATPRNDPYTCGGRPALREAEANRDGRHGPQPTQLIGDTLVVSGTRGKRPSDNGAQCGARRRVVGEVRSGVEQERGGGDRHDYRQTDAKNYGQRRNSAEVRVVRESHAPCVKKVDERAGTSDNERRELHHHPDLTCNRCPCPAVEGKGDGATNHSSAGAGKQNPQCDHGARGTREVRVRQKGHGSWCDRMTREYEHKSTDRRDDDGEGRGSARRSCERHRESVDQEEACERNTSGESDRKSRGSSRREREGRREPVDQKDASHRIASAEDDGESRGSARRCHGQHRESVDQKRDARTRCCIVRSMTVVGGVAISSRK